MKPSCWTPLPRLCCERQRRQELAENGRALSGPVACRAARGAAARLDRTRTAAATGILFVGGEPKVGKSLLVANLALALAAGQDRAGFSVPAARRVLVCQFELPVAQFVSRLATMRRSFGAAADQNLLVDTRAAGHLLSAPQGLNHFLVAAREAAAEVIVLDPCITPTTRMRTTRAPWRHCARACCGCAMLLKQL